MRTILLATSDIACPVIRSSLLGEIAGLEAVALITMPPRPAGRKLNLTPPPVHCVFDDICPTIPIYTPEKLIKNHEIINKLADLKPEALLAFSTGFYIPKALVRMTPYPLCIHPSPLPQLRGANPVRSALYLGWKKTSIALMRIEPKMDTGNVFAQTEIDIPETLNFDQLTHIISLESLKLIKSDWHKLANGELGAGVPQSNQSTTYARRLTAVDYRLDWNRSAFDLHNQIRALSTKPGAKTIYKDKELKVLQSKYYLNFHGISGSIITRHPESGAKGFYIYCNSGLLELIEVQPGGKNPCAAKALISNWCIKDGDKMSFPQELHKSWVVSYTE